MSSLWEENVDAVVVATQESLDVDGGKRAKSDHQRSSKKGRALLVESGMGFVDLTNRQHRILTAALSLDKRRVVFGSFDLVKVTSGDINFDSLSEVEEKLDRIILYEVKSTSQLIDDGDDYWCGITFTEWTAAQDLDKDNKYVYAFVDLPRKTWVELTHKQVLACAKSIIPQFSVKLPKNRLLSIGKQFVGIPEHTKG